MKITKVSCFFNKISASVLFLEFQYCEIFINEFQIEFQYSVVSSFIDSGASLALYTYLYGLFIEQQKQFYDCEASSLGVVWCSYNERTNRLHVYRRLLTNRLHGKAAEPCLANS